LAETETETGNSEDKTVDEKEQPFLEHLVELRSRILRSVAVTAVLFIPLYYFSNDLYEWLSAPLMKVLPSGSSMIATQVASPFLTPFKLSIYSAIFLGIPYLLHQVWMFVSPGLYRHEKRFATPLLISSTALFYGGMLFAYYLVFPLVFSFFTQVAPEGVSIMTDINQYLDFVLKMFLAFGIAFEIPIATMLLAWSGISTTKAMAQKRPYVVIGCFVAGMFLTPPDVISQIMLAAPAWLLFEVGLILSRFVSQKPKVK
jgi:sec-independent protein translocase protein TatC